MNVNVFQSGIILLAAMMFVSCSVVSKKSSKANERSDIKVLFIGNSYTDQIQRVFKQVVANSAHSNSTVVVIWGGGATLKRLIDNGRAYKWIEKEKWDYVVLQEQSKTPAIPGRPQESFHDSVDQLVAKIRAHGAEPVLYMTWGRRDGDSHNKELFPDYDSMQKKLSDAYRTAAEKHKIQVAPVGEAWSMVRKKDPELGRELYANDGSHPSPKGAFLASCVFFRTLFDESLEHVAIPEGMDAQEGMLMKEIVTGMKMP